MGKLHARICEGRRAVGISIRRPCHSKWFLSLGGPSEIISQISVVWGKRGSSLLLPATSNT